MIDKLEKTFFDTFEIKPKSVKRTLKLAMPGYDESDLPEDLRQFISSQAQVYHVYPQITDRILLELVCIVLNAYEKLEVYTECTVEKLKEKTLKQLILAQDDVYSQVRTLFKEG